MTIVLLSHKSNDLKTLGCFKYSDINKIIDFYTKLPGFSKNVNGFYISDSINTTKDELFLFQFWDKYDDSNIINEKLFETKEKAEEYAKLINNQFDKFLTEYIIEKYTVGEKLWAEGFATVYYADIDLNSEI